MLLPPVLRPGGICHQHGGMQAQSRQRFINTRTACGIDLQCRDIQGRVGARHFQQMRGFATRRRTRVQHAQRSGHIQPLKQQGRRVLGGGVLHRHPAFGKTRQLGHGHGLLQGQCHSPERISSQIHSIKR